MSFEDLTPEQMKKSEACKTPEDMQKRAKEDGYEFPEDGLAAISGGD